MKTLTPLQITDRVYGSITITEPVLLEIIDSPSLQRLKDIDQAGYFEPYYPNSSYSRFEHSVGVCALLQKYGAPLEEQINGLLHDISHSAFSHCIDYVLKAGSPTTHDYQDNLFESYLRKSEIPTILNAYQIDLEYILDETHFPLQEKDLPDLCADRIDYSLRNGLLFKEIESSQYFLDNLTAVDQQWVFKNFKSAEKYAELFLKLNTVYYSGLESAIMFKTVGDYLKYALSKGYITESELYATDSVLLAKIQPYLPKDTHLQLLFDRMNNKIPYKNDPENYESEVFCKSRMVDPLCWHDGSIRRVSEINNKWVKILARESQPKQYFIRFEK